MDSRSEPCPHCGKEGSIPYYYIALNAKLKLWCKDPEMCRKMIYHTKEKDHWLHANTSEDWGWEKKKELWDGKRSTWSRDQNYDYRNFLFDFEIIVIVILRSIPACIWTAFMTQACPRLVFEWRVSMEISFCLFLLILRIDTKKKDHFQGTELWHDIIM